MAAAGDALAEALGILAEAPSAGMTLAGLRARLEARADTAPRAGPPESLLAGLLRDLARHPDVRVLRADGGAASAGAAGAAGDGGTGGAAAANGAGAAAEDGLLLALRPARRMQTLGICPLPAQEALLIETLVKA